MGESLGERREETKEYICIQYPHRVESGRISSYQLTPFRRLRRAHQQTELLQIALRQAVSALERLYPLVQHATLVSAEAAKQSFPPTLPPIRSRPRSRFSLARVQGKRNDRDGTAAGRVWFARQQSGFRVLLALSLSLTSRTDFL